VDNSSLTGDDLLRVLATLANPHRLRVIASLTRERNYVSQLLTPTAIATAAPTLEIDSDAGVEVRS